MLHFMKVCVMLLMSEHLMGRMHYKLSIRSTHACMAACLLKDGTGCLNVCTFLY